MEVVELVSVVVLVMEVVELVLVVVRGLVVEVLESVVVVVLEELEVAAPGEALVILLKLYPRHCFVSMINM
jgi:hypothetical protein